MLDWRKLARESNEQLASHDLAEINLACAAGLPDAERIDVDACREQLNYFARRVETYTTSHLKQFHRKRWDFNNSEGYFRILCMITVLQRDLGVRYNPAKIPDDVPLDTADRFIHGVLFGDGGSCESLAVVYTAVGRRLGYPLKLVHARRGAYGHLFPRWDDPEGERFNIEATNQGLGCFLDDHYRTGRFQIDPEIERRAGVLQSMTPQEELATFLGSRAAHWRHFGVDRQAVESFAWASALAPRNVAYFNTTRVCLERWRGTLHARKPTSFPEISIRWGERRFPAALPREIEEGILSLEVVENLLMNPRHEAVWWEPLRRGLRPEIPTAAFVDFPSITGYRIQYKYANSAPSGDTVSVDSLTQGNSASDVRCAARAASNQFCFSIDVGAKDHDL